MILNLWSPELPRHSARIMLIVLGLSIVVSVEAESIAAGLSAQHAISESDTAIRDEKADLTLREALGFAVKLNPEVAASAKEVGALEGAALQARLWRNPELAIEIEDLGASQAQGLQRFTTIRIGQLIELGGKRQARVAAASLAQEIARQDYEAKRLELLARVANGFTDVLAAQERTSLAEESVRLAQDVVNAVSKRVQAGKAPPIDETKAKVTLSTARIEMEQAQRDLRAARKRLALLWDDPTPRFRRALGDIASTVNLPAFEALLERVRNSPAAIRGVKSVEQRQAMLEVERARRVPDVTVTAGVRRYSQSGDDTALLGVSIPLPFFDRNQGNLRDAYQRLDKAEDERAANGLRLQSELAQTYEALLAAHNEITVLRDEVLPGAKTAFATANRGYELGKFGFLEMLDAQRTLFQNQMLYLRGLVNYQKLVNEIERLIAAPLDSQSDRR